MKIIKTTDIACGINVGVFKRPEPILWCCQGMFCIIPIQIIQNAIDNLAMWEKFPVYTIHPTVYITWDQGVSVDPKVGYALLGE